MSETHLKVHNLLYSQKATDELKSAVGVKIIFHIAGCGGDEMATEARCEAGNILTEGWSKAQLGIFGFYSRKG